jgi:NADH:ubiquinone oxidoreductase subunit C
MYKKYIFPVQIFVILEKTSCRMWLNKCLDFNNFHLYIPLKWFYLFIQILKNELFLNFSMLIELTGIDMLNQNGFLNNQRNFFYLNRWLLLYNFYEYKGKNRLNVYIPINNNFNKKNLSSINSIDVFYNNANWLERETSEMYGIFFPLKKDMRKLLLDYSKIENPLLKDFPCEGLNDVFYNFFFNQVYINKSEVVEL